MIDLLLLGVGSHLGLKCLCKSAYIWTEYLISW